MPVSRRGFLLLALLTLFVACGGYLFFWPVDEKASSDR